MVLADWMGNSIVYDSYSFVLITIRLSLFGFSLFGVCCCVVLLIDFW